MLKTERTLNGHKVQNGSDLHTALRQDEQHVKPEDLANALKDLGIGLTDAQTEYFILSMDLHEDGGITQDELLKASMPVTALSIKRGAMQLIDVQKPFQLPLASLHAERLQVPWKDVNAEVKTLVVLLIHIEVLLYQRVLAVLAACGSDASGLDRFCGSWRQGADRKESHDSGEGQLRASIDKSRVIMGDSSPQELFLVLDNLVIRLHFGMSGGADFLCDSTTITFGLSAGVEFEFSNGPFDILNPSFDWEGAIKRLKEAAADRKVCDLVMDQLLLPGVGNVIKVEGLFTARIHPLTPGNALKDSSWWALLRGLRDCALKWYSALKGP
ncbi:Neil3 [Symbiodinium sp. CCMP2592]|nr:Neil3 [Symbiodinium sp. CCMP2592]